MLPQDQLTAALTGRYEIEREIGAGGMATVYLARDLKHHRLVALKVLNPELGAVLGSGRFMAEIEVTANLQHPNLLPLFDSGESGGLLFYVMPFVEGETLRARLIRERQLRVDEAVRIAIAIASALDYAHRHKVIHRDLKPENILMHEGQPLVMDFGIALAVSNAGGARITQTGLSLGTPQYMSPEQATGDHALDARTDIYSLGAVLYEMLVGDPPHTGSTVQAVIAKVITERPSSVRATRPNVPEYVEAALMTALAKLPADRFSAAADFAAALTGQRPVALPSGATSTQGRVSAATPVRGRRLSAREVVAWATAAAGIAWAGWLTTRTTPVPVVGRFAVALPESVSIAPDVPTNRLAMSRDGSVLAFVGRRSGMTSPALFLRHAGDPAAALVEGSDNAAAPTFSPDGQWLLYGTRQGESLRKVPTAGGRPQTLATGTDSTQILSASWGDGDQILFERGGDLLVTTPDGAEPRRVATADGSMGVRRIGYPEILPGGTHALVSLFGLGGEIDSLRLAVVKLADGSISELGIRGARPHFVPPDQLLYNRSSGVVLAVPFSLRELRVTGPPVRLLENLTWGNDTRSLDIAVAWNGWLTYRTGTSQPLVTPTVVGRSGRERPLGLEARRWSSPRVSPDGRRVVLTEVSGTQLEFWQGDLWILELSSGALARLTNDGASYRAEWSPDGSRIVYMNGRPVATRIISRTWDGSGAESVLVSRPNIVEFAPGPPHQWSAVRTLTPRDLYIAPTDSLAALRPFVVGRPNEYSPGVSPNGRWLAYSSDETGQLEVYVRPIPGPGARVPVSVAGGSVPRWSYDGTTLFYRSPSHVMAATISERSQLAVSRRDTLFASTYTRSGNGAESFGVFPGGRELLMLQERAKDDAHVYILVNWQQLLRKQAIAGDRP